MSPISKALFEMSRRIPPEVLQTVFVKRLERWRDTPKSIEEQILSLVIRPRVLPDCDLVGGTQIWVNLDGCRIGGSDVYETIFRIPKQRTNGRSIMSVLEVCFTDPSRISAAGIAANGQNNMMLQGGQAVMDAMGMIPQTSTARIELIAENTVLVRDVMTMPANSYLRCTVANDENLNNIQLRSYHKFVKLVEWAVKSYIYNFYIVDLDVGELRGGQQLGRIKEIIDTYADAEASYEDFLEQKWRKVAFMNDDTSYNRYLRRMIGGNR
ncbi:hypothetical protein [Paraburkholderia sp. BCC1886]|uniref:DUF7484 family protein n=1 Tax=Paraburkholderia sp. BCC1886 TaxID=2562670 RepID=UPI0011830B6D|nr:hypothetical protein [Paraburkholderia sp. BCC1886]